MTGIGQYSAGRARPGRAAVGMAAVALLLLLGGCQDDKSAPTTSTDNIAFDISGTIGECKIYSDGDADKIIQSDSDCVVYQYGPGDTLHIQHVNAAFNCCPGEISAHVSVKNKVITITERESEQGCRCLCLFDADYVIPDVPAGDYVLKMVEPYVNEAEGDEPLEFSVSLTPSSSGSYCIQRDFYPWNLSPAPSGQLVGSTDCKEFEPHVAAHTPATQDCIQYQYDGSSVLQLNHINAGFNCCPVITAEISVDGGVIRITEKDSLFEGGCLCLCLFDVQYEIRDLRPGKYKIVVTEPLLAEGDEKLEFTVDLAACASGGYCVERQNYPWQ
ncbi:MAG TPA: hypothetical protein VMY05_00330 [Acidobacteriota bacterium]|nr:hypothetical protein [Acidobacteriota bacterium]